MIINLNYSKWEVSEADTKQEEQDVTSTINIRRNEETILKPYYEYK